MVFSPNRPPDDYVTKTRALQAISPSRFRHNTKEIAALSDWARSASGRYPEMKMPAVIITGDADEIVSPDIHARHLARDIGGSTLIIVHNLGHKLDFIANDRAVAAVEKVAGRAVGLRAIARSVERRSAQMEKIDLWGNGCAAGLACFYGLAGLLHVLMPAPFLR